MRLRRALLLFILEVDMLENTFKTGLVRVIQSAQAEARHALCSQTVNGKLCRKAQFRIPS